MGFVADEDKLIVYSPSKANISFGGGNFPTTLVRSTFVIQLLSQDCKNYSVNVILDELSTIGFCYYCNMLHELVVNWTHNYVQDDVLICLLFEQTFNFNVLRFKLFFKKI